MLRTNLFIFAILFPVFLIALDNKFEYIGVENGLSESNVISIYQDDLGFIWFGTTNGLNKYDGYSIKSFYSVPDDLTTLSEGYISYMQEDKYNNIWIGTGSAGFNIFNPNSEKCKRITYILYGNDTINLTAIDCIKKDDEDNMWLIERNEGLLMYNSEFELLKLYSHSPDDPNSLGPGPYYAFEIDTLGTIWVGCSNGIISRYNPDTDDFRNFTFDQSLSNSNTIVQTMYCDSQGMIWVGTDANGVYSFTPSQMIFTHYSQGIESTNLSAGVLRSISEDSDGNILFGIDGGGINIFNKETGRINRIVYDITNQHTVSSNGVYKIFRDKSETIWIATYGGGINYWNPYRYKFRLFKPNPLDTNSLSILNVTSVIEDYDNELWFGTDGGGLNRYNPKDNTFIHYKNNPEDITSNPTNIIISLEVVDSSNIYMGTYSKGLVIFNKTTNKFRQYMPDPDNPVSIAEQNVWTVLEDSYGIIWLGYLTSGLGQFDKETETFKHYPVSTNPDDSSGIHDGYVRVLFEDTYSNVWIGTATQGIYKYDRQSDTFIQYLSDEDDENSLIGNSINGLYEDSKGNLWIATTDGLSAMNLENESFTNYTIETGIAGNDIRGVLEDDLGNIWISSNNGLSSFNPDKEKFRNFKVSDGLQGKEFNYTAQIKTSSGELIFCGKKGFNIFDPEAIKDNSHKPNVVLTDIKIFNKSVTDLSKISKEKSQSLSKLKRIILSHKQNVLSFEFAALDFANPENNRYKYMLEGFDEHWVEVGPDKRYATYTNLKGGTYTFRVIASNNDDIWNETGLSLNLRVAPPIYKRVWFILLIIILLIYLIRKYIRQREENLKKDKEILESKIQDGLKEVEKMRSETTEKTRALKRKEAQEEEQNWYNEGIAKFSDVLSKNQNNVIELSNNLISFFTEYLDVPQGAIYLLNDDESDNQVLELMAGYAMDDNRKLMEKVKIGEGQIGTCFKTQQIIEIENLPTTYANLNSGLGETALSNLTLIPLKMNEKVVGIVELISFEKLPGIKIKLVEKIGETLTSVISALKANERTKLLLEESKVKTEELAAQEEEMRQNMEEMMATQEELQRQTAKNEEIQKGLMMEKALLDSLMKNLPDLIYFKDHKSRFIRVSKSMLKLLGYKSQEQIIGKSDFDHHKKEAAQEKYDQEQHIIKTRKGIVNVIEHDQLENGEDRWVSTTKMPLMDDAGRCIGTFGISSDITSLKLAEMASKEKEEELMATQEELERIKKEKSSGDKRGKKSK